MLKVSKHFLSDALPALEGWETLVKPKIFKNQILLHLDFAYFWISDVHFWTFTVLLNCSLDD